MVIRKMPKVRVASGQKGTVQTRPVTAGDRGWVKLYNPGSRRNKSSTGPDRSSVLVPRSRLVVSLIHWAPKHTSREMENSYNAVCTAAELRTPSLCHASGSVIVASRTCFGRETGTLNVHLHVPSPPTHVWCGGSLTACGDCRLLAIGRRKCYSPRPPIEQDGSALSTILVHHLCC